jgi:hypothetical protein
MTSIRRAIAAALVAAAAAATTAPAATVPVTIGRQYSDLWWDPQESGWGMNIVHQGETAFVTLFVYGPDGKPTWYVASDARVFATDGSGNPAFRGTLYKTTGPWLGGPFDPAMVGVAAVGALVIEPRPGGQLALDYTAEGVSVSKVVVRQTFALPDIGGPYHGTFNLLRTVPGGAGHVLRQFSAYVLVNLDGNAAFLRIEEPGGRCEYAGTRTVSGRYTRIDGEFTCGSGETGTFAITELVAGEHGITGYLRTFSPSSHQSGRFAAARF